MMDLHNVFHVHTNVALQYLINAIGPLWIYLI